MSIGRSYHRIDAPGKVTGETLYPSDIKRPHSLFGKVLFSDQPHARMRHISLEKALAVPGVIAILTAADVPNNEYGLVISDQPVLVGPGSNKPHADVSRWEGDQVAFVVAETAAIATAAAALIEIDWEQLPPITSARAAMQDEILLHPENGSNILNHYKFRKGDMAAGWAAADIVVEGEYSVPMQEHAYLQPEAGWGYIDEEGRVTIEIAGQWVHEDQMQIMHALNLPAEKVRIIYPAVGGAFGGREDMSVQIVLALAAIRLQEMGINRPIYTQWSREESIVGHHKRHQMTARARWGATKDGLLTAVYSEAILDAGAYNYTSNKVLGNAHFTLGGPYLIPNAEMDSYAVYTNNVPGGAFRGFGAPQGAFVAESQMNKLAEALGIDPVELRLRNLMQEGELSLTQTPLPAGISIKEVITECARQGKWDEPLPPAQAWHSFQSMNTPPDRIRRGRGFACAIKNIGFSFGFPERCEATIELYGQAEIERAVLCHSGAEVGQGHHTALQQMAAAAVGLPFEKIEMRLADTATAGDSGSASASRLTWMSGNAIRGAAEKALAAWQNEERPAVGHIRFTPPPTEPYDPETGVCNPNFAYGYVAEIVDLMVDIDTGHVQLARVVCASDVGKAINPQLIEGQIEGAVVQAFGYAVTEKLQLKEGRILNPRFSTYLMPGILDIPQQVDSIILEIPDPRGPWGARGMAEMPFIPLGPAINAAFHQATGVWLDQLPVTAETAVMGLQQANSD